MQTIVWKDGAENRATRIYRDNAGTIYRVEVQCQLLGRPMFTDITNELTPEQLRDMDALAQETERRRAALVEATTVETLRTLPPERRTGAFGAARED